jgi:uncharacterized lipoprotein YajG
MSDMKNLDLNSMGVHEMNICEMQETDGGIIWFVVIAAAVFLTSCQSQVNIQVGGANNSINQPVQEADSVLNGNSLSVPLQP